MAPAPRLLDRVRERIRLQHCSIRTGETHLQWIKRFIACLGMRHTRDRGPGSIEAFLTHLAVEGRVAASTRNQALKVILFLYREVLQAGPQVLEGAVFVLCYLAYTLYLVLAATAHAGRTTRVIRHQCGSAFMWVGIHVGRHSCRLVPFRMLLSP